MGDPKPTRRSRRSKVNSFSNKSNSNHKSITNTQTISAPLRQLRNPSYPRPSPPLYTSVNMSTNISESGSIDRVPFKQENSLEKRTRLAAKIRTAHPDRVPVIVEKHARSKLIPDISKRKFLAPGDIAVTQLISEIRKHIELRPDGAIFLFVNGHSLPQSGALLSQVYEKHKDEDGFLYIVYSADSMMGASC